MRSKPLLHANHTTQLSVLKNSQTGLVRSEWSILAKLRTN